MAIVKDVFFKVTVVLILIGLGGAVWVLARQNRQLKAAILSISERQAPQYLPVGSEVPTLDLAARPSADGTARVEASGAQLLFFFRTDCPACQRTSAAWNRLATQVQGGCLDVAAVAAEPSEQLEAYREAQVPGYDVVGIQSAVLSSYQVSVVPQTMLIGPDGLVLGVWPGELASTDEAAVERLAQRAKGVCRRGETTT